MVKTLEKKLRKISPLKKFGAMVYLATALMFSGANAAATEPGKMCIVLDDAGNTSRSYENLKKLKKQNIPLTIAVMPNSPYDLKSLNELASYSNAEVLLHQPMEPQGFNASPWLQKGLESTIRGVGEKYDSNVHAAIYSWDSPEMAVKILGKNLEKLSDYLININSDKKIMGFNNHMGSEVTKHPDIMTALAGYAKENNLYVLDSLTASDSVLYDLSKKINPSATFERNGSFLDNNVKETRPIEFLEKYKERVKEGHSYILLGHIDNDVTVNDIIIFYQNGNKLSKLSEMK